MENFALWGLVISTLLGALCAVIVQSNPDPEFLQAAKAAAARRGTPVRRAAVTMMVLGFGNAILFTLLAVGAGDWRWAAIFWVPFAATLLGRAANSGRNDERQAAETD